MSIGTPALFPLETIAGLQCRVLLIQPDFQPEAGNGIELAHTFDTLVGESRTSIDERRPGRRALLVTQTCTLFLRTAAIADDWRKGLAALGPRPVAMPLWIDALPPAQWDERLYDAQKIIGFDPETGDYAVHNGPNLPGSPTHPLYAPLLVGRWKERPAVTAITDEIGYVRVTIREASPWSFRIKPRAVPGESGWAAAPDFPLKDVSEYGLEADTISAAREPVLDRLNAAPRWRAEGEFTFPNRLAIRQALAHFDAMQGALHAWDDLPAWFQPGADTDATPDTLTARFASDTLKLSFEAGHVAHATVGFLQQIATPSREQAQPGEFHLFQLKYQHDAGNPELFTDCDEPLVVPSEGTYQPRQVAHREIRRSLKPQDDKATLRLEYREGSLADDWQRARLFGWVLLTIWKCDPDDPAGTRGAPIYTGFVTSVLPGGGNVLTLEATLFGRLLKERAPGAVFGRGCSTYLFSPRCRLAEADHKSEGTAATADLSADGLTLTVHGVTGWGGTSYAENWFAHGILRTGTGRARVVVTILASVMDAGNLVVKLARPIFPDLLAGGGQTITLLPGCGRQYQTDCIGKFSNGPNFRGEPFMPEYLEQTSPNSPPTGTK